MSTPPGTSAATPSPSSGAPSPSIRGSSSASRPERGDAVAVERRPVALEPGGLPRLASELAEHRLERLPQLAPGDELLVDEPDGLASAEAAFDVVPGRAGDRAGAHVGERLV